MAEDGAVLVVFGDLYVWDEALEGYFCVEFECVGELFEAVFLWSRANYS